MVSGLLRGRSFFPPIVVPEKIRFSLSLALFFSEQAFMPAQILSLIRVSEAQKNGNYIHDSA